MNEEGRHRRKRGEGPGERHHWHGGEGDHKGSLIIQGRNWFNCVSQPNSPEFVSSGTLQEGRHGPLLGEDRECMDYCGFLPPVTPWKCFKYKKNWTCPYVQNVHLF